MSKVSKLAADAFHNGNAFSLSNTVVTADQKLYLHGNLIAEMRGNELWITSAGWRTATTKERLNTLTGVSISQKAGVWYLNGKEWNGEWICAATLTASPAFH